MSRDDSYEVYLVPAEGRDDEPAVESPVTAERLEFYDSGVWVDHAGGRDFFPYARVRRIREREATATAETGDEPAVTGDDGDGNDGGNEDGHATDAGPAGEDDRAPGEA